ncbi:MAG TPA: glycosyltransferase [Allosphingosinicella sp.]|nr:glycosyltransferase [Allosphingosinicella sp.]
MKIADVSAFYAPQGGGVRTYVEEKLVWAPKLGHDLVLVAPGPETRTESRGPGARIEWIASPPLPVDRRYHYFRARHEVQALLDRERPDFVEASAPWRSAQIVRWWHGAAPRALVMHADPIAAYGYRWLGGVAPTGAIDRIMALPWAYLRNTAAGFDRIVTASESFSERLVAQGMRNVVTNPMGVQDGIFSPNLRDEALRAELLESCGLPATGTLLLAVGRLSPEKRWPLVIDAIEAAARSAPVALVLIGDGGEREKLVRRTAGLANVRLYGRVTDRAVLARLLASGDALIHGCDAETFSIVCAEARASGLPIVAPDRGGAADHARASGGLTFRSGSAADAARAIGDFVRTGRKAAPALMRTMEMHFRDLFADYETLILNKRPREAAA